jgi:hypothetical protein
VVDAIGVGVVLKNHSSFDLHVLIFVLEDKDAIMKVRSRSIPAGLLRPQWPIFLKTVNRKLSRIGEPRRRGNDAVLDVALSYCILN